MSENLELQPFSLEWFEKNIAKYSYDDTKLFFENNRKIAQDDPMLPGTKIVVEWSKHTDEYDIQVIFPLVENYKYNNYLIYIYNWRAKEVILCGYRSHTVYPPVWDRAFSFGPDWYDYVATQKYINTILKSQKLPEIEIDESYDGKVVNSTKETPEEIQELLKKGKSYSILSVLAEAFFKNSTLEKVTQLI